MVCTEPEEPRKLGGGGRMAAVGIPQEGWSHEEAELGRGRRGSLEDGGPWMREAAFSIWGGGFSILRFCSPDVGDDCWSLLGMSSRSGKCSVSERREDCETRV